MRVRSPAGHQPTTTLEDQMRSLNASYLDQQLESIQRNPYFPISTSCHCNGQIAVKKTSKRARPFTIPRFLAFSPGQHGDVNATRATKATAKPRRIPRIYCWFVAEFNTGFTASSARQGIHGQLSCKGKRERDVRRLNCPGG